MQKRLPTLALLILPREFDRIVNFRQGLYRQEYLIRKERKQQNSCKNHLPSVRRVCRRPNSDGMVDRNSLSNASKVLSLFIFPSLVGMGPLNKLSPIKRPSSESRNARSSSGKVPVESKGHKIPPQNHKHSFTEVFLPFSSFPVISSSLRLIAAEMPLKDTI